MHAADATQSLETREQTRSRNVLPPCLQSGGGGTEKRGGNTVTKEVGKHHQQSGFISTAAYDCA